MGDIFGLILLIVSSAASTIAMLTLLIFLIPKRVQRTRHVIQNSPGRSFIIGFVNTIFFLLIATIFAQGGDGGGLLALIIVLALLSFSAVGLASLTLLLRDRIYPEAIKSSGLKSTLKSALLVVLAGMLPLLGWFVLAPIVLIAALGASIVVLVRRDGRQLVETAEESSLPY